LYLLCRYKDPWIVRSIYIWLTVGGYCIKRGDMSFAAVNREPIQSD
jgi:hypothetical protein